MAKSRLTSNTSCSRPMKLLLRAGRLCREVLRSWCTLAVFKTSSSVVRPLDLKQAGGLVRLLRGRATFLFLRHSRLHHWLPTPPRYPPSAGDGSTPLLLVQTVAP
jgi:hypothetical protein